MSGSLRKAGATGCDVEINAKQVTVTYDPNKVTVHELVQAVALTEPVHGEPYQAGLLVTVDDWARSRSKVQSALGHVKGIQATQSPSGTPGEIIITFAPLGPAAKSKDFVKASQIAEALQKAGVKFSGLPSAGPAGVGTGNSEEPDTKRKLPAAKSSAKSKPGSEGAMPEDKAKPSRPLGGASAKEKTKPARPPAESAGKSKEHPSEPPPRFQILAVTPEGVFLADHEAKLKKLVKEGDKFGDFVVKEVGNDDGPFVVLENPGTKDTIRVENERKDKEKDKDGDKPKEEKAKESKQKEKEAGEKDKQPEKKESNN